MRKREENQIWYCKRKEEIVIRKSNKVLSIRVFQDIIKRLKGDYYLILFKENKK